MVTGNDLNQKDIDMLLPGSICFVRAVYYRYRVQHSQRPCKIVCTYNLMCNMESKHRSKTKCRIVFTCNNLNFWLCFSNKLTWLAHSTYSQILPHCVLGILSVSARFWLRCGGYTTYSTIQQQKRRYINTQKKCACFQLLVPWKHHSNQRSLSLQEWGVLKQQYNKYTNKYNSCKIHTYLDVHIYMYMYESQLLL